MTHKYNFYISSNFEEDSKNYFDECEYIDECRTHYVDPYYDMLHDEDNNMSSIEKSRMITKMWGEAMKKYPTPKFEEHVFTANQSWSVGQFGGLNGAICTNVIYALKKIRALNLDDLEIKVSERDSEGNFERPGDSKYVIHLRRWINGVIYAVNENYEASWWHRVATEEDNIADVGIKFVKHWMKRHP